VPNKACEFAILITLLIVGCQSGRTISSQVVIRVAMIPLTDPGKIVRESPASTTDPVSR